MPNQPHPISHRGTAVATLLTAALSATVLTGCTLIPREQVETPPALVAPVEVQKEVYKVRKGDIEDQVTLRAILDPANQQRLYFKQGGLVKAVRVAAGDKVQAGQVLAELETGELAFDLRAAEIAQEKAQLALDDARARSASGYERKSRELDLELTTVALSRLKERLAQSQLTAPYSGIVTAVNHKVGESIPGGEVALAIADPTDLLIDADVLDRDLAKLQVGQQVRLDFSDLSGGGGAGVIVQLPNGQAQGPTAHQVRVRMQKPDPKAQAGMTGKVVVIVQAKQGVLLLQNAALRSFSGRTYVVVQTPQGKREVDVVTGIQGDMETEIVKGLHEGDQVIGR